MKRYIGITAVLLMIALVATTSHVLAAPGAHMEKGNPHDTLTPEAGTPAAPGNPQGNPPGNPAAATPGAMATQQADKHALNGKPEILRGTIAAVDAGSITLTQDDGSSVTVGIVPETKIHVPGPQAGGDTLTTGMRAVVMAVNDPSTNALVARMIVAIPGQPVRVHRVGTVTAYTAGSSITIQATDGNSYTFALTSATRLLPQDQAGSLAVGSLVTVIAPRVPSSIGWTATGIVVHPASQ